jgi:multidrug efflux pump subunit AcrB
MVVGYRNGHALRLRDIATLKDDLADYRQLARFDGKPSVGIGITGVAGPDEQEAKPVGTIHIAIDAMWAPPQAMSYTFPQGRGAVKRRAVTTALVLLRQSLLNYSKEPWALV